MCKDHDIYEDTCLHAGVLADRAVADRFPGLEDEKTFKAISQWLESKLEREYRETEDFRRKLSACGNEAGDHEDANKVRDWLALELLPSWLPDSIEKLKAPTTVWRFEDAPADLQTVADQGGDEDWIVELPPMMDRYGLPFWIEAMDSLREPKRLSHPSKPGWQLVVGCH